MYWIFVVYLSGHAFILVITHFLCLVFNFVYIAVNFVYVLYICGHFSIKVVQIVFWNNRYVTNGGSSGI